MKLGNVRTINCLKPDAKIEGTLLRPKHQIRNTHPNDTTLKLNQLSAFTTVILPLRYCIKIVLYKKGTQKGQFGLN